MGGWLGTTTAGDTHAISSYGGDNGCSYMLQWVLGIIHQITFSKLNNICPFGLCCLSWIQSMLYNRDTAHSSLLQSCYLGNQLWSLHGGPWEMVLHVGVWLHDHPPRKNITGTTFHHAAVNSNGQCTFLSLQHLSGVNFSSSSETI